MLWFPLLVPSLVCVRSLTQPCWHTGLEYPATLHDIVSWCVDINAVPKKAVLRLLAESCSSKVDADRLLLLSSRGGKQAYDEFVGLQRLTLLDLLALFPSSNPSVAHLLSCLPALPPRVSLCPARGGVAWSCLSGAAVVVAVRWKAARRPYGPADRMRRDDELQG